MLPGVAKDANGYTLFNTSYEFLNYQYTSGGTTYYPFRAPFFKEYVPVLGSRCC